MCISSNGRLLRRVRAARLALAGSLVFAACHAVQGAYAETPTSPVFMDDFYVVPLGEPERVWTTGRVEHMRGLPFLNIPFSEEVSSPAVGDSDISDAGKGVARGEIEFHSIFEGYEGIFVGRYAGRVRGWVLYAKGVYHGVGPMEGVTAHIRFTFDYVTFTGKLWVVFSGAPL